MPALFSSFIIIIIINLKEKNAVFKLLMEASDDHILCTAFAEHLNNHLRHLF